MNRRGFISTWPLLPALMIPKVYAGDSCKPFQARGRIEFDRPGSYCLTDGYIQEKVSWGGHTSSGNGWLIGIGCGSVTLDMQGHTYGSNYGLAGVLLRAWFNREAAVKYRSQYTKASLDNRFVVIRNGIFDFARGESTGWGISLADQWDGFYLDKLPGRYTGEYIQNEYMLENLKVLCNAPAVKLEGSYSVIRNCVLETCADVASFTAGPNVLIENCEIRLRRTKNGYIKPSERRAAIVLRDGSNTIIRNNIIRIDYGGDVDVPTHCILIKDGAKNVLIEGNTFVNVKGDPVTLEDGSEAIIRDNKFENRLWPF